MADRRDVIAKEDVWNHGDIVAHWRWGGSTRRGGSLVMEGHIGGWGAR